MSNADLNNFKAIFISQIEDTASEPVQTIINRISVSKLVSRKWTGHILNLSSIPLTKKICQLLSTLFTDDKTFVEINFNECSLSEECVKLICNGLADNLFCQRLDIKGNSIKGSGVSYLGKMLKTNLKLKSLCLDWNGLGLIESDFMMFCTGLSSNTSLQMLELKNNQISHLAASYLASALKNNTVLKYLDLRWNNVGLIGARCFVNALEYNKTLVSLQLEGNDIPTDILKSIYSSINSNLDRNKFDSVDIENKKKPSTISDTVHDRKFPFENNLKLGSKLFSDHFNISNNNRYSNDKLYKLHEALEDRKSQFHLLTLRFASLTDELTISESRNKELSIQLIQIKDEANKKIDNLQLENLREKQEKLTIESKLNHEIRELTQKNYSHESKLRTVEDSNERLENKLSNLKEELQLIQNEFKLKKHTYEESLNSEKQRYKELLKEVELNHNNDMESLKRNKDLLEKSCKEREIHLEKLNRDLINKLEMLDSTFSSFKSQREDEIRSIKIRMTSEEKERHYNMDQLNLNLQKRKEELENQLELVQSNNNKLITEKQTLKQQIVDLQQDIADGQTERSEEIKRLKLSHSNRLKEIDEENLNKDKRLKETYSEIEGLKEKIRNLKDVDIKHSNALCALAQNLASKITIT